MTSKAKQGNLDYNFEMVHRKVVLSIRQLLGHVGIAHRIRERYRYLSFKYRLKKISIDEQNPSVTIGAAGISAPGWIATEQSWHDITSQQSWSDLFMPGQVKRILAEHVMEHLHPKEAVQAIKNFYEFLEPGGYVRIAVPDGNHWSPEYIENVRPGGLGPGALDHKVLYTFTKLYELFTNQGFIVNGLEYFTDSGEFKTNPWKNEDGMIHRSFLNDERNRDGVANYTSIIIDAFKPIDII
jgi:predicted SAM-dependent methyltransferase